MDKTTDFPTIVWPHGTPLNWPTIPNEFYQNRDFKVARNSFQHLYFDGSLQHSISLDVTIMVSKNCPQIDENVAIIFLTQ